MSAQVIVKPRTRAGSWATFCRRYVPQDGPEGNCLFPYTHRTARNTDERHTWTVVDCDGVLYVVPGYAIVNYHASIVTQHAWSDIEFINPGYRY